MRNTWVITDTHFLHDNVRKHCNRPIDCDSKMLAALLRLSKKAILIHLGDVCLGKDKEVHGTFIEPLECKKILVLGNHDRQCLSEETRLLTKKGYKYYHELIDGDVIPTVNLKTNKVEFHPINAIYRYKNTSNIYVAKTRSANMEVTNHHTVIHQRGQDKSSTKWNKSLAENLWDKKTNFRVPVAFGSNTNKREYNNIYINKLKLLAWIMTDGSILPSGKLIIYQSKIKYISEIKSVLKCLNIEYKQKIRNRKIRMIAGKVVKSSLPQHVFSLDIHKSREFSKEFNYISKYQIPDFLNTISDYEFNIFINEMIKRDGAFKNSGTCVLWGKRSFLEGIMGLCVTHSKSVNICKQTGRPHYYLCIRKSNNGRQFAHNTKSKKRYNGVVWCVNVKNNVIFVELNGKPFVTGNSAAWYYDHGWDFVCTIFRHKYFGKNILFSHQPKIWDGVYDYNLHGHFHNMHEENWETKLTKVMTHRHVLLSVEKSNYQPINLNFITSILHKQEHQGNLQ